MLVQEMKDSDRYAKVVEWSEEDQCYIGSCPGLMFGGCHGDNEFTVFEEPCEIVEECEASNFEEGCGRSARRDLCGVGRVTGRPNAMDFSYATCAACSNN
jgi:hypothetical protein